MLFSRLVNFGIHPKWSRRLGLSITILPPGEFTSSVITGNDHHGISQINNILVTIFRLRYLLGIEMEQLKEDVILI
jgi:hypothetical protein